MSKKNINKPIFGKEILFNSNGQVISKKTFYNTFINTVLPSYFERLITQRLECTLDKRKVSSSNLLGPK